MEKYRVVFSLNNDLLYVEQVPRCWQRELQGWFLWEGAGAALHWARMISASFKLDPAQDTAECMSTAGGTSVETYLR